jgi:hypothetical protein
MEYKEPIPKFKVGDKVRVVNSGWGFHLEDIGVVVTITAVEMRHGVWNYFVDLHDVKLKCQHSSPANGGSAREPSFELVEAVEAGCYKPPEFLTLSYQGITVTLDPTIARSRRFAQVFLDAVYGGRN